MWGKLWGHKEILVPVLLLLLGGIGWLIQHKMEQSNHAATIVGKVAPPPSKVTLFIDDKSVAESSESGWFRIEEVKPGDHEIRWEADGKKRASIVKIEGGQQNRIDLPSLSIHFETQGASTSDEKTARLPVTTESHKWFAGTKYTGEVDLSPDYPFIWQCSGGTCTLEGPYGTGLNMEVCKLLSKKVGPLTYYYNDAGMTWSETSGKSMLDDCNCND